MRVGGAKRGERRGRAIGPGPAAVCVSAVLALSSLALWREPVLRHVTPIWDFRLDWWQLCVLAFGSELVVLHVQVRRQAQAISLNELAIVIALFFAMPIDLLVGWVIAVTAIAVWRRQSLPKAIFNVALCATDACLALLVFYVVRGGSQGIDARSWAAAFAAMAAVAALDVLAVGAVIGLVEGSIRVGDLGSELLRGLTVTAGTTTAGLVAVHAVAQAPYAALPVLICVVLLLLGYRSYAGLAERHLSLERVHQVSRVLSSTPEVDELLRRVLHQIRDVLLAERAEVVFVAAEENELPVRVDLDVRNGLRQGRLTRLQAENVLWARLIESGAPLVVPRGARDPAERAFLEGRGCRDAVAVPLRGEAGIVGAILAGDRLTSMRSFDENDVRLLHTVADQAGMALQRGELADRLRHDALHDALTGLPNRSLLQQRVGEGLTSLRTGRLSGLAIVVLELRDFRAVNEVLGHAVGDRLLVEVGNRLAAAAGSGDVVARLGGDEFAVLLTGVPDSGSALEAARRVRSVLEQAVHIDGIEVDVGTGLGVAVAPGHGEDAETLLKRAEAALAAARRDGNDVQLYEASLERPVSPTRLALLSELRQGIQSEQLAMFLQPQADLHSGRVVGVEALVRWMHPLHGLLGPHEFIPLAERSGLIRPLTSWMLAQAIDVAGAWRRAGRPLSIAVNLSARSVLDPDLVEGIETLLQIHRVPAPSLTLEITESSVLGDPRRTREVLERLHGLGVRLSIDDFGTGYSSLSYLRQLPVQEVKIDRSFVAGMLEHLEDETIVRSIVDLGANLGLEVVAEGVEDQPTWDRLLQMGCTRVQGYYLGRPMPVADFEHWLEQRRSRLASSASG